MQGLLGQGSNLVVLAQVLPRFFYKGPNSERFRFCRLNGLYQNYSTRMLWCESSYRQNIQTNHGSCIPIKLYIQKQVVGQTWSLGPY